MKKRKGLLFWLPPSVATFIYTVVLKPRVLRKLAHRAICCIIPERISIHGVQLELNRRDAIVSGNLALGCYETFNLDFFVKQLKPGQTFMDIGANIGLYSVVAAGTVGEKGRVLSVEPSPENVAIFRRSLEVNGFKNVEVVPGAIGEEDGTAVLFLNDLNKADHRLYNADGRDKTVPIAVHSVDSLLRQRSLKPDWFKIDTQGYEHKVWRGMRQFAASCGEGTQFLMEFWPWGIRKAGDDPVALLADIRAAGFTIYLVDGDNRRLVQADDATLLGNGLEREHCDMLVTRRKGWENVAL